MVGADQIPMIDKYACRLMVWIFGFFFFRLYGFSLSLLLPFNEIPEERKKSDVKAEMLTCAHIISSSFLYSVWREIDLNWLMMPNEPILFG